MKVVKSLSSANPTNAANSRMAANQRFDPQWEFSRVLIYLLVIAPICPKFDFADKSRVLDPRLYESGSGLRPFGLAMT